MKKRSTHTVIKFIKSIHPFFWVTSFLFLAIVSTLGYVSWYGYQRAEELSRQVNILSEYLIALDNELATTTALLQEDISETHSSLAQALDQEKQKASALESKLGSFQQEVGNISGTVSTLEKLSKTDPELLQKYSKVFFLNEHYEPERLTLVPDKYDYVEARNHKVHEKVWPYLQNMLDTAAQQGVELYVYSAFRPFEEQRALKEQYTVVYGEGTANQFSADQGYSEHQLGTTVDLITTGIGGTLSGFEGTGAYQWLLNNAYKYGFVLSYPKNNNHYVFEPWHWRFVGVELATSLHNSGKDFYDLEQREIDEYLVSLFE